MVFTIYYIATYPKIVISASSFTCACIELSVIIDTTYTCFIAGDDLYLDDVFLLLQCVY